MSLKDKLKDISKHQKEDSKKSKPSVIPAKIKTTKKVGRPADRVEGVSYRKIALTLPSETVAQVKKLLGEMKYNGTHETQNSLVNAALLEYVKKHSSK